MNHLEQALAELRHAHLLRRRSVCEAIDATHVLYNDQPCLLLAGNSYLGLTHHPAVQQAAAAAALQYGTGSGGSRLTTGSHSLYGALEGQLAAFKHSEDALVFSSGYAANVGVLSALGRKEDVFFSDALNHASLIDGCRLSKAAKVVYRHNDMGHLEELLAQTPCTGQRYLVSDGVFSMDGDIAPLPELVRLAKHYQAEIILDDAHATGVLGPGGGGTAAHFGLEGSIAVQLGTLSKALASEGGFVCGSKTLISYLLSKARSFIFSTAMAPATVAAATAALRQLQLQPELAERLQSHARLLRQELLQHGLEVLPGTTPIIPLLTYDTAATMDLAEACLQAGLVVSGIRPPTVPHGESRLRLTVCAAHKPEELRQAAQKIAFAAKQIKQERNAE